MKAIPSVFDEVKLTVNNEKIHNGRKKENGSKCRFKWPVWVQIKDTIYYFVSVFDI